MGAQVLHISEKLVSMGECWSCGIAFAAPEHFVNKRHEDHQRFYCPNGHAAIFNSKSEVEKLREQLKQSQQTIEWQRKRNENLAADREQAKRQAAAARGQVTKIKNRVGNGVCPCCNRSFANLMRHMQTKHPTFKNESADE